MVSLIFNNMNIMWCACVCLCGCMGVHVCVCVHVWVCMCVINENCCANQVSKNLTQIAKTRIFLSYITPKREIRIVLSSSSIYLLFSQLFLHWYGGFSSLLQMVQSHHYKLAISRKQGDVLARSLLRQERKDPVPEPQNINFFCSV